VVPSITNESSKTVFIHLDTLLKHQSVLRVITLSVTLDIPGNTWQYPSILLQYFPILNNTEQYFLIPNITKQYLTNLVLVGITWYQQSVKYHCQYDFSIVKVSSEYGSDGFLSVWFHSGIDSGNFC